MSLSDGIYNRIWKYSLIFCISYLVILRTLEKHVGPYITKCFLGKEKWAYSTDIKKTINLIGSMKKKNLLLIFHSILKMCLAFTLSRYLDRCIMPTSNIIYSPQTYGKTYSIFNYSKQTQNKLPCVLWHWMLILYYHNVTFSLTFSIECLCS